MGKQRSKADIELERYRNELDRADTAVLNATTVRRSREINDVADRDRLNVIDKEMAALADERKALTIRLAAFPKEVEQLRAQETERIAKLRQLKASPQMVRFQALQRAFDALKSELLRSNSKAVRDLASSDISFDKMQELIREAESE